jgi:hypothetical protein
MHRSAYSIRRAVAWETAKRCLFSIFVVGEIVQVFVTTTVGFPQGSRNRLGVPGGEVLPG